MSYLDIITLIINTVTLHDNIVDTELTFTQGAEYVAPQYDQVDGNINKIYFYICISPVDLSDTEKKNNLHTRSRSKQKLIGAYTCYVSTYKLFFVLLYCQHIRYCNLLFMQKN